MQQQYEILFTVELLHKFFADQLCPDLSIAPSQLTTQVMNGHRVLTKSCNHQLSAAIRTDSPGTPFIAPGPGMQMTFFLTLRNPLFFNYTNLPTAYTSGKLYYFTNRNANASSGKNFLSTPTPYDPAKTYAPGDLALNATGTVFQATRTNTGTAPPADNAASTSWMQIDTAAARNRYSSEADALQWLPSRSTYTFPTPQSSSVTQVWAYDPVSHDYTDSVLSQTIPYPKPLPSFTLDLTSLSPGKYKLSVNGAVQNIYINDELTGTNVLAVIEVFQDSSIVPAYQLLDPGGKLRSPLYSVFFLNRATIWKYRSAGGVIASVTDNTNIYQFAAPDPATNSVASAAPIPLNETALSLSLKIGSQTYSPIECASPQRLVSTVQSGDTYACSEIFLNY
jgi:hypothetical protein